ncbi:unnamed protein product [Pieris brassicae]|uniref:Uncharacterized protein n=1 Tax=Pieris brassicae TaxID=7116 RepID=A0A9P0U465_PIEBR|nr:unnamed protein product [Pieris brassicae]
MKNTVSSDYRPNSINTPRTPQLPWHPTQTHPTHHTSPHTAFFKRIIQIIQLMNCTNEQGVRLDLSRLVYVIPSRIDFYVFTVTCFHSRHVRSDPDTEINIGKDALAREAFGAEGEAGGVRGGPAD